MLKCSVEPRETAKSVVNMCGSSSPIRAMSFDALLILTILMSATLKSYALAGFFIQLQVNFKVGKFV